jgi:hypothetical protein
MFDKEDSRMKNQFLEGDILQCHKETNQGDVRLQIIHISQMNQKKFKPLLDIKLN